jgi:hypothetical protein
MRDSGRWPAAILTRLAVPPGGRLHGAAPAPLPVGPIRIALPHLTPAPARRPRRRHPLAGPATLVAGAGLLAASLLGSPAGAASSGWAPAGSLPGLSDGRIWQIAFDPANPAVVAAATDAGVYLSSDTGLAWTSSGLHSPTWTVAFDTAGGATSLFAGLKGSGGIRVSHDGGTTWSDASTGLPNRNVRALAVSPAGLAAGTDDGVALSQDGASWYPAGLHGDSVSSLAVAVNPPAAVFYAGIDYPATAHGYLWALSTSAGSAWSAVSNGLPAGAVVNWIAVGPPSQATGTNPILVLTTKGAYRSTDGGKTWNASAGIPSGSTLTDATFSPLDPNLVYAGADAGGSSGGGLWRSTDGGQTFSDFSQGLPSVHPSGESALREVESLAVAPGGTYPTVLAALDPYQGGAAIYRQVDATAPSPPALPAASGAVATVPASAVPASAAAPVRPAPVRAAPAPQPALAVQVLGDIFHFPVPLLLWVILAAVAGFLWYRWKRHYYVAGPP